MKKLRKKKEIELFISSFTVIDCILQPFVKMTYSFIQDSQNSIRKSIGITFPMDSKLYSCDFESLYSNINLSHALVVISEFICSNFSSSSLNPTGFYYLLKLIFEHNVFEYNKKYFIQISGIAMGSKCGPSVANIYISLLEFLLSINLCSIIDL